MIFSITSHHVDHEMWSLNFIWKINNFQFRNAPPFLSLISKFNRGIKLQIRMLILIGSCACKWYPYKEMRNLHVNTIIAKNLLVKISLCHTFHKRINFIYIETYFTKIIFCLAHNNNSYIHFRWHTDQLKIMGDNDKNITITGNVPPPPHKNLIINTLPMGPFEFKIELQSSPYKHTPCERRFDQVTSAALK